MSFGIIQSYCNTPHLGCHSNIGAQLQQGKHSSTYHPSIHIISIYLSIYISKSISLLQLLEDTNLQSFTIVSLQHIEILVYHKSIHNIDDDNKWGYKLQRLIACDNMTTSKGWRPKYWSTFFYGVYSDCSLSWSVKKCHRFYMHLICTQGNELWSSMLDNTLCYIYLLKKN